MTCSRLDSGFCTLWVHGVCLLRQAYNVFQVFQLFVKRFDKGLAGLAGLIDWNSRGSSMWNSRGSAMWGWTCDTGDKCGNNKPAHFYDVDPHVYTLFFLFEKQKVLTYKRSSGIE